MSSLVWPSVLARVKIAPPPLVQELVHRPRLLQRLDQGSKCPLTLITSPAGYGKTSLLAEWLVNPPYPGAWLSLDEHDDSLSYFTAYFVAAIQTVFPGSMQFTSSLISSAVPPRPLHVANSLSNDIADLPEEFILVLDDYHAIKDEAVHELMSDLVRRLPAPLHLIIVTRADVSLPLGKLRAAGQLCELWAHDLRFSLDETRGFLERAMGGAISEELVQRLQEQIGGWVAGLRFASLLLQEGEPPQIAIDRLITRNPGHLWDYMFTEVLLQKSPAVQDFLLKTSLVERFTERLCAAILGLRGADTCNATTDQVVLDGLLIVERDALDHKWYQYIDLYREFLRAAAVERYVPQTIAEVHQRASQWFADQGMITEAVEHAIAAGNVERAARLVGENVQLAMDYPAPRPLIEAWLRIFPSEMLQHNLELVMARVWLLGLAIKLAEIPPLLAQAEQLLATADLSPDRRRQITGEIAYHRMGVAYFSNDAESALALAADNAGNLPAASGYVRGMVLTLRAFSLQMVGRVEVALQLLTDALVEGSGAPTSSFTLRLMVARATIYLNNAHLVNIEQTCRDVLRITGGQPSVATVAAHHGLGLVNYERNRLEAAAQHFAAVAELAQLGSLKIGHEGLAWLALTQQAQGSSAANSTLQKLLSFTDETNSGAMQYAAEAYRARLALMQGDLTSALHWAQSVAFSPRPHMTWDVEANLTRLRTLLATRKPEYLRTMLEETQGLLALAESLHYPRRIIQLYTLLAMAYDALDDRARALEALEQSIALAEPRGLLRTFLDMGPGIARLLNLLMSRSEFSAYIYRILATGMQSTQWRRRPQSAFREVPTQLIEHLTLRELQVMQALAQHQTNKEIAQKLIISANTVNAHIDHILQKLSVSSRQEAVKVALAYGLVDEPRGISDPNL